MKCERGDCQTTKMMSTRMNLLILLLIIYMQVVWSTNIIEQSVTSRTTFKLRAKKQDNRLSLCKSMYSACGIAEDRIWYKPRVTPLCLCRDSECPLQFSTGHNKQTISYNGRAQFKFCSDVTQLPICIGHQTALIKKENSEDKDLSKKYRSLEAKCYCPYYFYHYEYLNSNTSFLNNGTQVIEHYKCKKLRQCKSGEFCGHITEDTFQPYYICSCPRNNMCLIKDKRTSTVKELLYDGLAYKGICTETK